MKMADLKEEHLIEIVKLYEEYCGRGRPFREVMYGPPETILEKLRERNWSEYRVGSRWDGHSKLIFSADFDGNVKVNFYPNFSPNETEKRQKEAEEARKKFEEEVEKYLG